VTNRDAPDGCDLLTDFLLSNGITKAAAARALGVSPPAIHCWLTRRWMPSEPVKLAIETWTSGRVPSASWPTVDRRSGREAVMPFNKRRAS
jgi:DNA-binding transcriptional regulator YdaS (Cro superfamily)